MNAQVQIDREQIAEFCRKWRIKEFCLFGSVLREDFRPDSDVDVLVSFAPEARWSLLDWVDMEAELATIFGRDVDLVEKECVEKSENYIRRRQILNHLERLYVA